MAKNMYWAYVLTGGGAGALDAIDGSILNDLDAAIVVTLAGNFIYSLDADSAAVEQSPNIISPDVNAGNKRWVLVNIVNQQFNNLIKNGSFESWSAGVAAVPDGWTLLNITVARSATHRIGTYACEVTADGTNSWHLIYFDYPDHTYFQGRTVTAGVWVYQSSGGAQTCSIRIYDGVDSTANAVSIADTTWTWIIVTHAVNAGATTLEVSLLPTTAASQVSVNVAIFDGAILVEGTICPTFCQHHNDEHLKAIDYQDSGATDYDYGLLRMECGVIGAGANEVTITFGTAFTKILCVLVSANANTNINAVADDISTTIFHMNRFLANDASASTSGVYWVAIGVG